MKVNNLFNGKIKQLCETQVEVELIVYIYTPEVYPNRVRAFALGLHTSAARLGAISTPYVAQVCCCV